MTKKFKVDNFAEPMFGIQMGGGELVNTHSPTVCDGRSCVIHNPSEHHMRSWPLNWRGDRRIMERICPCGVGHPDPDDAAYLIRVGREYDTIHGCCGCCRP